ncbi:MAG: hypothetical protein HOD60_12810 [Candidatus Nitrosopelagicus sp.]|nr:hypothetical protein [Candidatus Nitrosopelagicus sp.]
MYQNDSLLVGHLMMIGAIIALSITPFAFADDTGFSEPMNDMFNWVDEVFTEAIEDENFDNSTKTNLQQTLDSGTDAGKSGVALWFGIHEFFVNLIFAGTTEAELGIDKDLITIVSMIMVSLLLIGLVIKLIRENTKIAMLVVIILLALGAFGLVLEF